LEAFRSLYVDLPRVLNRPRQIAARVVICAASRPDTDILPFEKLTEKMRSSSFMLPATRTRFEFYRDNDWVIAA
jgi:hypothetical protein